MTDAKRIKLFGGACFFFGVVAAFVAVHLAPGLIQTTQHKKTETELVTHAPPLTPNFAGREPISGRIEAIEIPLGMPNGMVPEQTQRLQNPRWSFAGISESQLTRFLDSCELRPVERTALLDKRSWSITPEGCVISPAEQLVWSLQPEAREKIYSVLSRNPTNFAQCFPFRFPLTGFEAKFKSSGLPVERLEQLKRLTYTNAGYLCFTDLQAMKRVLGVEEFKDLVETLYEVPTYLLRVHVQPDSDVEGLIKYWGKGGREDLIAPVLNALAKVPGGSALNISYLLPPFARLRLYTYPYASKDPTAPRQDCFFTSLNFFNENPDTNFFNGQYTARVLHSQYEAVTDTPLFGDLITLVNAAGDSFHACVFIAADYVYTKNGVNPHQPWVLMKLSDMVMMYSWTEQPAHVRFLRRKFETPFVAGGA